MYTIVAICGKSGSGKDTLLKYLCQEYDFLNPIVSYTTREKRDYEVDGKDYHFITHDEMAQKILNNEMVEVAEFGDDYYGTGIESLKEDKINIGVLNPAGLRALQEESDKIRLYVVRILTTDKTRLIRSLTREQEPDIQKIFERYFSDEKLFASFDLNSFIHVNVSNEHEDDLYSCGKVIYNHFLQYNIDHLEKIYYNR